ncbi:MAG: hypothetical protein ACRDOI_25285 [Trebonia sp.]
MAIASCPPGACADEKCRDQDFVPATLRSMRRCPARAEYLELCFTTREGPWSWCFPEPARRLRRRPSPVALALGPYGVLARRVGAGGEFGTAIEASVAMPMILAGADVLVARYLVTAGR